MNRFCAMLKSTTKRAITFVIALVKTRQNIKSIISIKELQEPKEYQK